MLATWGQPALAGSDGCQALREDVDARIAAIGRFDARHSRLPMTPWLRSDRFLQDAMLHALAAGTDPEPILAAMASHDRMATRRELPRTVEGFDPELEAQRQRLDDCRGHALAVLRQRLMHEPDFVDSWMTWQVPDAYRGWQRLIGGYFFARPFLRAGAERWRTQERDLQNTTARPAAVLRFEPPSEDVLRSPVDVALLLAAAVDAHPLGWPWPDDRDLDRLARRFAPLIESPSRAPADRIGRLAGEGGLPTVRTDEPTVYFEPGLVRFGTHVLLQLSYTFWFPERVASGPLDPYAGRLDGLVWRVTLGADGRPLVWDSIHACGCYYTVVIPEDRPYRVFNPSPHQDEDPLVLKGPRAEARIRLLASAGDHFLRWPEADLAPATAAVDTAHADTEVLRYRIRPYAELLEPGHGAVPIDRNGIIRGTSRLERLFLWPAGIKDPGAMRINGRHAVAFLGRRHFDEAELIDGLLVRIRE